MFLKCTNTSGFNKESIMAEKVNSIEELEQLKAAAAAQGTTVPNYSEWSQIMQELNELGVETTGTYEGDKARMQEVQQAVEDYIREMQIEQAAQESRKDEQKVKALPETDSEQTVKANVANATSSQLIADYMKIYHLLP